MEWIVQPLSSFKSIEPMILSTCDCERAYSTPTCRWYSECNCTATLVVNPNPSGT